MNHYHVMLVIRENLTYTPQNRHSNPESQMVQLVADLSWENSVEDQEGFVVPSAVPSCFRLTSPSQSDLLQKLG